MQDAELNDLLVKCADVPQIYNAVATICYKRGYVSVPLQLLITDIIREYLENNEGMR